MNKKWYLIAFIPILILGVFMFFSFVGKLMSTDSDVSVFIGLFLLSSFIAILILTLSKIIDKFKKKDQPKNQIK